MTAPSDRAAELGQLRRMRLVSVVEGCTYSFSSSLPYPSSISAAMPSPRRSSRAVHGLAFLLYVWTLIETVSGADFLWADMVRMVVAASFRSAPSSTSAPCTRRQALLASA